MGIDPSSSYDWIKYMENFNFLGEKGTYLLPIKKEVRRAENIGSGNKIILNLLIENIM